MSSGNDGRENGAESLRVDPGTQALVALSSMQWSLRLLPAEAYKNLLVVTTSSPDDVERAMAEMDVDPSNVGVVPVTGSPVDYDGPVATTGGIVPDDLTGVSIRYSEAIDALTAGRGWVLVDALGEFLLYGDEERVFKFLDHVTAQTRDRDLRGVYAVAKDAVEDATYASLQGTVDREFDLR